MSYPYNHGSEVFIKQGLTFKIFISHSHQTLEVDNPKNVTRLWMSQLSAAEFILQRGCRHTAALLRRGNRSPFSVSKGSEGVLRMVHHRRVGTAVLVQGNSLFTSIVVWGLELFSDYNPFDMATHYLTFLQQNLGPELCYLSIACIWILLS